MTHAQKIIKNKVGVLELAKHLGNVSRACQVMGYILPVQGVVRDRRRGRPGRNFSAQTAAQESSGAGGGRGPGGTDP